MKKSILFLLVVFSLPVYSQVYKQIIATKVTKINQKALDPGIGPNMGVYQIISGKVSATPISIPAPNNVPIGLQHTADRFDMNHDNRFSVINNCSLLRYLNNTLDVQVKYTLGSNIRPDLPVFAGAWFYDKYNKAVEVGYIAQKLIDRPSGKVIVKMGFKKFPVTTEYLKIMLFQDGKEIATRSFEAGFLWKPSKTPMLKTTTVATAINTNAVKEYVPDLEITAIKVIDKDNNTLPYESGCATMDKIIFVTNIGDRESAPYILSVGYTEYHGNRGRYKEVKRFSMPSLLPGKQTSRVVNLPSDANNIKAEIIFNYNPNGEHNTRNNSMEKRCIRIK